MSLDKKTNFEILVSAQSHWGKNPVMHMGNTFSQELVDGLEKNKLS